MSYPDQLPPSRDEKGSSLVLGVLAVLLFLAGAVTLSRAETPVGGCLAGILVTVAGGAAFLAGWEPRR